jgi:hypothetical protein
LCVSRKKTIVQKFLFIFARRKSTT